MKLFIRNSASLLIVFSVLLLNQSFMQEKKKTEEIKIKTSAACDMCKERIEKALSLEKGVKKAVLDVDSKIVTVQYNPKKTNPDVIRKAISKIGYDADGIPADPNAYNKLPKCCQKGGHD